MKADRDIFGPRLRRERERRGIALKDIAESTKIKESLLAELEQGDFSKWPQGIFRRAHLSAYVSAIGLPPQPILAEFLRLFPEQPPGDPIDQLKANDAVGALPIAQPVAPAARVSHLADRAWIVFFDFAAICLMSSIAAGIADIGLWAAFAIVGLAYSVLGSACFDGTVGAYVQRRIQAIVQTRSVVHLDSAPVREAKRPRRADPPEDWNDPVSDHMAEPRHGSSADSDIDEEHELEARRASA